jgi:hypothetical protein
LSETKRSGFRSRPQQEVNSLRCPLTTTIYFHEMELVIIILALLLVVGITLIIRLTSSYADYHARIRKKKERQDSKPGRPS